MKCMQLIVSDKFKKINFILIHYNVCIITLYTYSNEIACEDAIYYNVNYLH